jgi:DNA-binding PucR family transcriptional regulator
VSRLRENSGDAASEPDEQSSLAGLLENLGRDVIQVVAAPHGLDVPVRDAVIYDPTERSAIASGAIVLAVGVRAGTTQSDRLLSAAAEAGAAAVVFKAAPELPDQARDSASLGVALLSVPEEMTWTQLHGLLNVSRFTAESTTRGGIAGVPLGDLFALANAVAGVVGGAVTIEDPSRRVLAYSTLGDQPIDAARRRSILGRQVPDSPGMRTLYRRVLSTSGVMTADRATLQQMLEGFLPELLDLKPRSAVAIRAGSHAIGSIWVSHDESRLDPEAERALAEAARIAVPHVIQARAARDVERRMRAEMLLTVLEGSDSAEETAARLGFAAGAPLSVVAFETTGREPAIDELQRERLVDLVVVHCEASYRQTAAVALGPTVYALLQGERELEQAKLVRLAQQVQSHAATRLGTTLIASVGSTVEGVREVARARREAERVLGVLRADARGRTVASIDDVRSEVVLLELRELSRDHPSLARGKLERVLAHDAEHRSSYGLTLRAYLDAFGEVPVAAARISVHPNTFRYRMRRLVELFDLDLDDPEERLVLELQLRLLAVDGPPEGPAPAAVKRRDGASRRRS